MSVPQPILWYMASVNSKEKCILMFLESLELSAKLVSHIRPGIEIVSGITQGVGLKPVS